MIRNNEKLRGAVALAVALAAVFALSACRRIETEPKESEKATLPTDVADTVAPTVTTEKPVSDEPTEAPTEGATESATEPATEAPQTEPPADTQAPQQPSVTPEPVDPVIPSVGEPSGSLDSGVSVPGLTASQNAFLSGTVFVGDSICSGLEVYGVLPDDNVIAAVSASAHDIDSYTFEARGGQYDYVTALRMLDPKTVVFFMGMNDTYLSAGAYCTNYTAILNKVHAALPNAAIYVASITPVTSYCTYTTNANINDFNAQIRSTVASLGYGYVDISSTLTGSDGALVADYSGSDGIHLVRDAYLRILSSVCAQLAN